MALLTVTDERTDLTVIYDSVTGIPLPFRTFTSKEAAQHFLMWIRESVREPEIQYTKTYLLLSHPTIALQNRWSDQYIDGGTGELTDAAQSELYEDAR